LVIDERAVRRRETLKLHSFRWTTGCAVTALLIGVLAAGEAKAQGAPAAPAPYSIPFQLRPAAAVTAFRIDSSIATFDTAAGGGRVYATFISGAYKLTPELGVFARAGWVRNNPPGAAEGAIGSVISNPALGGVYVLKLDDLRIAAALITLLPFGSGGGDMPDRALKAARASIANARAGMDNAFFGANDLSIAPGIDIAYVTGGLTVQLEATFINSFRVRGAMDQPDEYKLNFTSGLHAGWFAAPWISFAGELRYQRFLKAPKAIEDAPDRDAKIGTLSAGVGPRFHFQVSDVWIRPAIVYTFGIDDPMAAADYDIVQLDVPIIF
jgi:hypothetical protein